jgi:flagellar biogenesis protein FliO
MNGALLSSITTLFSALALVIGIFLVGLYLATYLKGKGLRGGWIKVLAASDLGGKRTIAVVEVADEVLVLGIAPQQISLLSKVENLEVVQRLKAAERPQSAFSFLGYLEQLSAKMAKPGQKKERAHV